MARLILLFAVLLFQNHLFARPAYYGMLLSNYPGAKIDNTIKCQTCHNGRAMNLYGKAFSGQFLRLNKADIFKKIGPVDSDNDGMTNDEEIMIGRNPGVAGK